MIWRIEYASSALDDLSKLERTIARRIVLKIGSYHREGHQLSLGKKLKPPFEDCYRLRVGDYRVIFELGMRGEFRILFILRIKHRKNAYE